MKINSIDLNLFLVFQAVYVTRSVTLAGERINMTQSAVSNALKRIRERFNDRLFVRTADGMVPTPLADRLIGPIEAGIRHLSQAMDQGPTFSPETSSRELHVAVNDIGQLVMMPTLIKAARERAPGVRFETVDATIAQARHMMVAGQIDLAVGSWEGMGQAYYRQRLFDESFMVLMSATHPLASRHLTADAYMAAEHVAYRPSGTTDLELQQSLQRSDIAGQRNVVLTAAHSLGLSSIVATSNLLLTAPTRLAQSMTHGRADLRMKPTPFAIQPFLICQQWHERFHQDSGNRWLRQLMFELFHEPSTADIQPGADDAAPSAHNVRFIDDRRSRQRLQDTG